MLTKLILKNLILVESSEIPFTSGFNVISGETGAGKTALIEGVSLVLGERADHSTIRTGCEMAQVQAIFECANDSPIFSILHDASITCFPEEPLIIQRDLLKSGKTKAWINQQPVSLSLLQQLAPYLIDHVGQHAHVHLKEHEFQRQLLDLFAVLEKELFSYCELLQSTKEIQKSLDQLLDFEQKSVQLHKQLFEQQEEIAQADLKDNEDESLFQEYQKLTHAVELKTYTQELLALLKQRLLPFMQQFQKTLDKLLKLDTAQEKNKGEFNEAFFRLEELHFELNRYFTSLDDHPQRMQFVEERLKLVEDLKKKYRKSVGELLSLQHELENELKKIDSLEDSIKQTKQEHLMLQSQLDSACSLLSDKRKEAAALLESLVTTLLKQLNMAHAEVKIKVQPTPRSQNGQDEIQFWMKANKGESLYLLKDTASGGELARLLLALKVTLAQKNPSSTLIFDEIDSNVGGETARIIGEKLKDLGKCRQVICITHFPQVANFADHHIRVYKVEKQERTVAIIEALDHKGKKKELMRMLGGKELTLFS